MTSVAQQIQYRWTLTDLQFKVLCEDRRIGGLPRPFTFTTDIKFADDYEAEKKRVRVGLEQWASPEFDAMVHAVTKPDIMVVADLWNERQRTDPEQRIRVHAVRRDDRGYVITQRPGGTIMHSGGFDIAECASTALARTVMGLLPDAGAGSDPESVAAKFTYAGKNQDLGETQSDNPVFVSVGPDAGVLKVIQGHLGFRDSGIIHEGLIWRDFPDDGRYVLGSNAEIAGMDGTGICTWIEARMAEIMVRLEP